MADVALIGVRGIPNRYGGFERLVEVLAPHLAASGRRVSVFCEDDGAGARTDMWNGVERHFIRRRIDGAAGTIAYDLESFRAVRPGSVALIFGYGTAIFQTLLRDKSVPHCVNMDGIEWARAKWGPAARQWLRLNERIAARLADELISDHPEIRDSIHRRLRAESTVIAYGVAFPDGTARGADHPILQEMQARGFDLVIARPEPENQIHLLLEAWELAERPRDILVVGNFEATAYGRSLIARHPEARFCGPVYDIDALDRLRAGSVLYLHGHSVGGTNPSLIEAMAAGALVVAHDNPFNRWVLGDGGMYFGGAADLATILARPVQGQARSGMLAAAADRCRQDFLWPEILARYTEVVERLESKLPRG
jgi:glycosyltransferase involved in cell wall biosynthesis